MNTDNAGDKAHDPTPNQEEPFPREVTLKYDTKPIVNLANAIDKQTNSQQQEKNQGNTIGERQLDEQKRANGIAEKMMYATVALAIITLFVLIYTIKTVNVAKDTLTTTQESIKSSDSTNRDFLERATQSANAATASANALLGWEHTGQTNYELSKKVFDSISPRRLGWPSFYQHPL